MKKVGIAVVIVLLASAVSYAGYWAVQSFLTKKAVKALVSNKDGDFLIGSAEASVSAFPFSKNILFKNVKYPTTASAVIELNNVELQQTGFSSHQYLVKNLGTITIKDPQKNIHFGIRFALDTEIVVKGEEGKKFLLEYKGSGYEVLDSKNNLLFVIKNKNSNFSLSLMDSILAYKAKDSGSEIVDDKNNVISASGPSFVDISVSLDEKTKQISAKIAFEIKDTKQIDISDIRKELTAALISNNGRDFFDHLSVVASKNKPQDPISFAIDTELKSLPVKKIPGHIIDFKLKTFEIVTALYKIALSGNVNTVEGDFFPSGKLTLKIENFNKMLDQIKQAYIDEMAGDVDSLRMAQQEVKAIKAEELSHQNSLLNANDRLSQEEIMNEAVYNDLSSQKSLNSTKTEKEEVLQIIEKFRNTVISLAKKNPLSKGDLSVLAISRDKNSTMDAMINNTPLSQVVMEFMAQDEAPVVKDSVSSNAAHLDLEESIQ